MRIALLLALTLAFLDPLAGQDARLLGVDANYEPAMAARGKTWSDGKGPADPYSLCAHAGFRDFRIRLWVGDEGMNRLTYAIETARRARKAGLKPYLVLFLSDRWSDMVKQPVPDVWQKLTFDEKLAAVEAYAEKVVKRFAAEGIELSLFEIGNEIDFGLCGEFEEQWPRRVSREYMAQKIWPREAALIKAAEAGMRKAWPQAKFILHLAQWNDIGYCIDFWKAMIAAGVQVDYAGLSYFPSSAEKPEQQTFAYLQAQAGKVVAALHRPVLICESGYPAEAQFGGQFATWNHPVEGYPLTEAGQAKWIADFLALTQTDPSFAGAFYWSPEWYDDLWSSFAFFNAKGEARPALSSVKLKSRG